MRLLVFSDIHGNIIALRAFLETISDLEFDRIFFLGDIFGYYYEQKKCLEELKKIPDLTWLKGNHDDYALNAFYNTTDEDSLIQKYGHSYSRINERFELKDMQFIADLPTYYECNIEGKKIGFFHGRPDDPLEGRIYNDSMIQEFEVERYDIIFFGHTHSKIDRLVGRTRMISPGSIGQPRDGKGYGFVIYDTESGRSEFKNVDVDNKILKSEIDRNDPDLMKLYDVLSREDCHICQ